MSKILYPKINCTIFVGYEAKEMFLHPAKHRYSKGGVAFNTTPPFSSSAGRLMSRRWFYFVIFMFLTVL